ncbi:hypothetical protein KA977_00905 [Candidatus Dependentiae bacterium]|nr:hypothetical protein [Candidatus Dependentiae bacterium]
MVNINIVSSYSNASSVKNYSSGSVSSKNIPVETYNLDSDTFIKSFNVSSIYDSSTNEIDWEKVQEELCIDYAENEGILSSSGDTKLYNLKTGDAFDEVILRYSLIKSKISEDKSKDHSLKDYIAKLDELFNDEIDRIANLIGIQITDFYSGNFTGQIEYPMKKKSSVFKTSDFVESTSAMINKRIEEFQKFINENNYEWKEYSKYAFGDTSYITYDFLDHLKNTDTVEEGIKSSTNLNFSELNSITKIILSLNNNFDTSAVYSKDIPSSAGELVAGMNIGLSMLKVNLASQQLEISTESSKLLSNGVLKNISNLISELTLDEELKFSEDNIYLYGGYISDLSSYQTESNFQNKFNKAVSGIKKYFEKNESEYDSKKIINSAYSDWNKFLKFIDLDNQNSFYINAPSQSTVDITT